jgi:hypothetical protein
MTRAETWDDALAPVRRAITEAARRREQEALDRAGAEADAVLAAAAAEAGDLLAQARAEGARTGAEQAALEAARVRRDAHRTVLAARTAARADLSRRVAAAVEALSTDPRYPALRARLAAECRDRLGPDAEVVEAPGGGVVGRAGSRRLDLSLAVLAALAAEEAIDRRHPDSGARP